MSALPEEADGRKRPLLVPKLWFLVESSQRKEVHSGSLCGRHNYQLKKKMYNLRVKFYLGQNEDCSLGSSIKIALRDCSKEAVGEKSIHKVLVKGEFNAMKHLFYKRFLLVMRI